MKGNKQKIISEKERRKKKKTVRKREKVYMQQKDEMVCSFVRFAKEEKKEKEKVL